MRSAKKINLTTITFNFFVEAFRFIFKGKGLIEPTIKIY